MDLLLGRLKGHLVQKLLSGPTSCSAWTTEVVRKNW